MIFYYGSRLFGKVDVVPGLFHVATKFGHVWFIPLLPTQSYIIFEQKGNQWRGKPIRFSFKSMLAAWLRAGGIAVAVLSVAGVVLALDNRVRHTDEVVLFSVLGVLGVLLAIGAWKAPWFCKASYDRAVALVEAAKLSDEARIMVEAAFGRITTEEANRALAQAASDREEMARLAESAPPA